MRRFNRAIWLASGVMVLFGGPALSAAQTPEITAEQVLEKSIEATGGREAARRITSTMAKGTFEMASQNLTAALEVFAKAPNKRLIVTSIPGFGDVRQGFDGQAAWAENPMQGAIELQGEALAIVRRDSTFNADLNWRELYQKAELKGKQKLGDREAWVVELTPKDTPQPVIRYYDAENFLLQRIDVVQPGPTGLIPVQVVLSDYREQEGMKVPFRVTQTMSEGEVVIKIAEVKYNVEIDDAKFAKPEAAAK